MMNKLENKLTEGLSYIIDLNGEVYMGTYRIKELLQKEYIEFDVNERLTQIENNLLNLGYEGCIGKHQINFKTNQFIEEKYGEEN